MATTVAPPNRWFVVIEHRRGDGRVPSDLLHAKEMGTMLTACRRPAGAMDRRWELAFLDAGPGLLCQPCVARVSA